MAEDHGKDQHGGGAAQGGHEGGDDHGKGHKSHGGGHGAPHGGGSHEEHAGAPEWLISFADNTALLMGFFVILLAMNMAPKKAAGGAPGEGPGGFSEEAAKMIDLEWGIREAFHNRPSPNSKNPADVKLFNDWHKLHGQDGKTKQPNTGLVGQNQEKQSTLIHDIVVPNGTIEFAANSTELTPKDRADIAKLVTSELLGKDWIIEVRGHVAASEVRTAELALRSSDQGDKPATRPSDGVGTGAGYAMSYQRAFTVAMEMSRNGLPWRQMRIVASSDTDRVVQRAGNDSTQNRRNQRVEIIQTQVQLPRDPLSQEPNGG